MTTTTSGTRSALLRRVADLIVDRLFWNTALAIGGLAFPWIVR